MFCKPMHIEKTTFLHVKCLFYYFLSNKNSARRPQVECTLSRKRFDTLSIEIKSINKKIFYPKPKQLQLK